ncbi:hypothetical protein [Sphingobium boeckii]|uniref:Uncharacterized protein n=1 Tax=Sphingobium boeckii TaxID=1082345 RepID=A0A7W9AKF2_9SPHN|nr:hypothetical protein [Sphingobium boeckii]MBB5687295.1 hypothetical protein [Sphingobium boeckii]
MRYLRGIMISSATVIALLTGQAHAASKGCVTGDEVQALALVLMPHALKAVAETCAPVLPQSALLNRPDAPIFARYQAQSATSMALAQSAFVKVAGGEKAVAGMGEAGLDLMTEMLVPQLTKEIALKDCGAINRMIELFEPLPPENMAGAIATILQIVARDEAEKSGKKRKKSDPDICPLTEDL